MTSSQPSKLQVQAIPVPQDLSIVRGLRGRNAQRSPQAHMLHGMA